MARRETTPPCCEGEYRPVYVQSMMKYCNEYGYHHEGLLSSLEVGKVHSAIPDKEVAASILVDHSADVKPRLHSRSCITDVA